MSPSILAVNATAILLGLASSFIDWSYPASRIVGTFLIGPETRQRLNASARRAAFAGKISRTLRLASIFVGVIGLWMMGTAL